MATKPRARSEPRVRRRLDVDERRRQLVQLGMELFSTRAYDDVWIEEIAERAGVSRGLLYHYFPTKRDFYVAVTRAAAEEAGEETQPDPALSVPERIRANIDAFLRYAEEHSHGFLTAWRGGLAGDPEVRAIGEEARQRHATRIIGAIIGDGDPPPLLRLAVRGWVALAQEVTARWLEDGEPAREVVRDMLTGTLEGVVAAAGRADPDVPAFPTPKTS
jgi:AcrR family transcriptional regulator